MHSNGLRCEIRAPQAEGRCAAAGWKFDGYVLLLTGKSEM